MGVLTDSLWPDLCFLLFAFWTVAYIYASRHFNFWLKRGVPYIKPLPFLGNFSDVVLSRLSVAQLLKKVYEEHQDKPFVGMFAFDQPFLLVRDRQLLKLILDNSTRSSRWDIDPDSNRSLLGPRNIFGTYDERWTNRRQRLIPKLTASELRQTFSVLNEIGLEFASSFETLASSGEAIKVQETMSEHIINVISNSIYGIQGNAVKTPQSILCLHLLESRRSFGIQGIKYAVASIVPFIMKAFEIRNGDAEFDSHLRKAIADKVSYREKHNIKQKDFLELLIRLMNRTDRVTRNDSINRMKNTECFASSSLAGLDDHELVSQEFLCLLEDFNISFHIINFTLYHLALNNSLQNSLRAEAKKYSSTLTYEAINNMKQLDWAIKETLRIYPPFGFLDCKTSTDINFPGTDTVIPANTWVAVSIWGHHMDPGFYTNSAVYNPERFSQKNELHIEEYSYMPFGTETHKTSETICLLYSKIMIFHMLLKYLIETTEDLPPTLQLNSTSFLRNSGNGVPLRFRKIC